VHPYALNEGWTLKWPRMPYLRFVGSLAVVDGCSRAASDVTTVDGQCPSGRRSRIFVAFEKFRVKSRATSRFVGDKTW